MSGELKKLRIDAYADTTFSAAAAAPHTYSLQINPETYKHQHATAFQKESATDTAGASTKFIIMEPQTLSFEFYLDATGVVPGVTDLNAEIATIKSVVYNYNGDIHSPNYLMVSWSGFVFKCRLTSLNIDYTLFRPDGTPLRAKLDMAFQEYLSPDEIAKRSKKASPDMTHLRTVQDGDTLPVMCHRIYGDSRFYLAVARHNDLTDFRRLTVGSRLMFPPLGQP